MPWGKVHRNNKTEENNSGEKGNIKSSKWMEASWKFRLKKSKNNINQFSRKIIANESIFA